MVTLLLLACAWASQHNQKSRHPLPEGRGIAWLNGKSRKKRNEIMPRKRLDIFMIFWYSVQGDLYECFEKIPR